MRYAHVLDQDVHNAVAAQAKNRIGKTSAKSPHKNPHIVPAKSQKALQSKAKSC